MTAARVKLEGLDSTQAAAQNALQGMSTGQDASQHSFMTQWQAAMQEYYKTQAQQSPGFGGGMSYPGLWGSQSSLQPFLAAYGGMPFYGGSMVANPYAMLNSPTQAAAAGVPDLSNAQPAQTNPGAAQPTSTQPSNDASKAHSNDNTSSDMDEHPADTDHSAQRNTGATQPLGGSMAPANGEGAGAPVAIAVPQMLNPLAATSPHPSPMALEAFRSAMSPQVASQFPNDQAMDQQFPLDERELKRQRRKQSNRESARRSRLRKQAETEELARTVKDLNSEVGSVKQVTDQLRALVEKLDKEKSQLIQQVRSLGGVVDPALEQPISLALPPSAPSTTLPPATTMAAPGSQGPTAAGPPQAKQGVPGFNPASAQLPVSFPVAVPMQGAMPQMMSETTQQVNNILANTALANKGQVPTGLAAVSASANMATLPGTNRAALPLSVHPMFQMAQQPATMLTQPEGLQMAAGHYLSNAQAMRSFTTAMAAAVGDNPSAAQYLGSASALTNPMLSVEGLSLPNIASLQGGLAQLSGSLNSSGAFAVQNGAQLSSWGLPLSSSVPAGSAGGVGMGAQPTLSQELAAASAPVAPMPIGVPNESEMTAALASEPLVMSQGADEGDPYGLNQPQSAMDQDPLPQVPQGHFMAELQEIGVAQEQPQQEEDKGQWVVDDAVQPGDGDGGLEFNEDVSPGDGAQELGHGQQEDSGAGQVVGGDNQEPQKGEEGEREVEEQDDDYEGDLGFPDEEGDHQD